MILEPGGSYLQIFSRKGVFLAILLRVLELDRALVLSEPRLIRASPFCQRADLCTRSQQITNREAQSFLLVQSLRITRRFQIYVSNLSPCS